jgi:TolB-like protein
MHATVAVLPFENPSGDPEQAYFARGFVEDVTTELSRFATLDVVHPDPDDASPPAEYLLQGSVRRLGDEVRVAVQLVESGGRQVWAERFDASAASLYAVQDEIAARVASTLAHEIDGARLHEARRVPLASLEVYDCWLRGLDCLKRGTLADDDRARAFFEHALELDPLFARAYAGLSLSHFNEWSCQAWERWDEKERLAYQYARRAAELDDRDALVQVLLGRVHIYRRQYDESARHVDRALALNPSDADVLAHAALCRSYLGDPESAYALVQKAFRLNPHHPDWYLGGFAVAACALERHGELIARTAGATQAPVDATAYLAASYAFLGDRERAAGSLATFLVDFTEKITFGREPELGEPLRWVVHVNPFRRPEHTEILVRGLELAGLPVDPDERATRPVPSRPSKREAASFRREGELWTLGFDGVAVKLTEAKGFHDLAELLGKPETRIHCLELAGRGDEPRGDAPVLDSRARRELTERARELHVEIAEADERHDRGRGELAREELDRIVTELEGALGLGRRSRRLGSAAERARAAVTWRIRNAIRKIGGAHPTLGRHLDNAIQTGTYCAYTPEKPTEWSL